jgi:hypothetical protein
MGLQDLVVGEELVLVTGVQIVMPCLGFMMIPSYAQKMKLNITRINEKAL